ncbi:hypothetical protein D9758_005532 [Tetrapyrgos nigripes]|uniref:CCHC-type domain-containing protein n=1 Tax=Tetrapyrgos nigripes TaxID=182062 RepID=A0A8H5GH20_9AGAR|nr:hypothetical protein D9758_005532 [Tetrapyrgos nigripes]
MSLGTVPVRRRPSLAIVVVRKVTSLENAPKAPTLVAEVSAAVDPDPSATVAERLAISLAHAPKLLPVEEEEEDTWEDLTVKRLATLAVVLVTYPGTVSRARNVTTATRLDTSPEIAPSPKRRPAITAAVRTGHMAAACPQRNTPTCYNCGEKGHLSTECTSKPKCHRCGEIGHISAKCPSPRRDVPYTGGFMMRGPCRKCGEHGHIARDCTRVRCYNCNGTGHISSKCPEPQRKVCYKCGSPGHIASRCPDGP